jgi:DNA-binding transcriptional regulator YdaS (Cro superfamily)
VVKDAKSNAMNKQWFKDQFKRIGKPQSALARELNVEPSAVSRALNGNRRFKADEIVAISRFFGVTIEAVVSAIDGKTQPLATPFRAISTLVSGVINTTTGGTVDYFSEKNAEERSYPISFKPQSGAKADSYIGLTVQGNNHPDYPEGTDLVFAKTAKDQDVSKLAGKTLLYEVISGDIAYHCIGKIVQDAANRMMLTYKGKDGLYREHLWDFSADAALEAPVLLQEKGGRSAFVGSAGIQANTVSQQTDEIRPVGVLVKSIKNE